ncbi:Uncharacterised protein [Streptococcus pneumoniae]|nr:Uncharacterised protein [Streptococcus pneumoniae]CJH11346.1 Uncharacterised protein [Streptococcus pneumoniae]CJH89037.1 Uncharacterised protein [Streptococcus pneumoniae]CKE69406.1 Uncharacterised protein [Streptococcus pneumoniae]
MNHCRHSLTRLLYLINVLRNIHVLYRNLKLSSHAIRISCAGSCFCYLDLQSQISVLFLLIFVQHIFRFLLALLHQQQQPPYIIQFHFSQMSDKKVTSQVVQLIRCNHHDVDNESFLPLVMLNVQQVYLHNAIDLLRNRRRMYHFVISVALANLLPSRLFATLPLVVIFLDQRNAPNHRRLLLVLRREVQDLKLRDKSYLS